LDAGIVPYSTLNYLRDHLGIADSLRSHRLENNRAATESTWQRWFPANFVTEMREQVRLWFYAMLFMSVTLENRTPYLSVLTYEEMRDENGNPFSKSGGNAIPFDDAAEKMGADPMRWLYAAAPLTQVFRFGYGPAHEVKRKLLTLWNCYKFFIEYANIDKPVLRLGIFRRQLMNDLPRAELDRWILARLQQLIASCNDRFEQYDAAAVTREIERFIDDLSTWYVRQSRRRFWKSENDADKAAAYQTLYDVLVSIAVLIAPIVPFMAEELFQKLVRSVDRNAPESVHLCGYPHGHPAWVNEQLVGDIATVRRVVSLGLAARNAANLKVRQPLMRALVKPADAHQRDVLLRLQPQILNELNVKQVEFTEDESKLTSIVVNPNLAKVGPKFGKRLLAIRNALAVANPAMIAARVAANETFELDLGDGSVTLVPEDVIIGHTPVSDFAVSSDGGCTVALDTRLTRELVQEGVARDFVRHVQELRKTATLNLTDRITVYYAANGEVREAITNQASYIRRETLAEQLHANKPPSGTMTATVTLREKSVEIGIVRLLKGCTQPGEDDAKQFDH
jgi:isoleucyl-tRNA synthetase